MILSIETASYNHASIALVDQRGPCAFYEFTQRRLVGASIVSEISDLLVQNNFCLHDLNGIAVDCGPGSFTGIRIGIATAKGLADGANLPVHGLSVFDLYPKSRLNDQLILIDAKAGGGFYYEHRPLNANISRGYILPADISTLLPAFNNGLVMGEILNLNIAGWKSLDCSIAVDAAKIGCAALDAFINNNAKNPDAIYLHSQIKIKSKKD